MASSPLHGARKPNVSGWRTVSVAVLPLIGRKSNALTYEPGSDDELGDADEPFIAPNIEQHGDAREQEEDGRSDTVDNSPTSAKQTDQEVFDATDVEGDDDRYVELSHSNGLRF